MSWEQDIKSITRNAGVDLTTYKNKFVMLNATGQVVPCTNGAMPIGILRNNPGLGQSATVAYAGVVKCQNGASAVTPQTPVKADANACAASVAATAVSGAAVVASNVAGLVLEAGAANDIVPVLLTLGGGLVPTTVA